MTKRKRNPPSTFGFGKPAHSHLDEEVHLVLEVSTMLMPKVAAEKLTELDPSKTQAEWEEWLRRAVALRFAKEISCPDARLDSLIEKFR